MRFHVDAQLPPGLCRWLAARGHEANHVNELGLGAAAGTDTAAHAESEGATLISKDEDFLILRQPDRFALLWLRCGNATNRALGAWLEERWERIEELLGMGERLVEVSWGRMSVRVTVLPSSKRSRFSGRTFIEKGKRATSPRAAAALARD
jgi:predicted nuclease of predicted toxin-antitoxin system